MLEKYERIAKGWQKTVTTSLIIIFVGITLNAVISLIENIVIDKQKAEAQVSCIAAAKELKCNTIK